MYPLRVYVWDAIRHGIKILPPHVNHSSAEWTAEAKAIRAGLDIIQGLTRSTIEQIVRQRNIGPFTCIDDLRTRVKFHRPQLQNLIHVGACDGLGPSRPVMLMHLHCAPLNPQQLLLFDMKRALSKASLPEYDRIAKLKAEVDLTGIPFSLHPALLLGLSHIPAAQLPKYINRHVTVAGFIATARRARTADGRTMGFVTLEDHSGLAEISFFPDKIDRYRSICSIAGPIWVTGKVTEHLSSISLEGQNCGRAA